MIFHYSIVYYFAITCLCRCSAQVHFPDDNGNSASKMDDEISGNCSVNNLFATSESPTSILATWEAPNTDCGIVDQFRIEWYANVQNGYDFTQTGSYVITDLIPCYYLYLITVRSQFSGSSVFSPDYSSVDVRTMTEVPGEPRALTCATASSTEIQLTWLAPDYSIAPCEVLSYDIYAEGSSIWDETANITNSYFSVEGSELSTTLTNLNAYSSYIISMASKNSAGSSENVTCNADTSQEVPGPPEDVTATPLSYTSMYVSWTEPQPGPGIIIQYWVTATDGILDPIVINTGTPVTNATLTNLIECTTYNISVFGETDGGNGSSSDVIDSATFGHLNYSNPQCLEKDTHIFVRWTTFDRTCTTLNVVVVSWERTFLSGEMKNTTETGSGETDATFYIIKDYYHYSTYDIDVATLGDESSRKSCQITTSQGAPGQPEEVYAEPFYSLPSSTISITWLPPKVWNGIIFTYWVQISDQNYLNESMVFKVEGYLYLRVYNLKECTNYSVEVAAETEGGNGSYSAPVYAATEGFLNFTTPTCSLSDESIIVSWNPFSTCNSSDYFVVSWNGTILWAINVNHIYGRNYTNGKIYIIQGNEFYYYTDYDIRIAIASQEIATKKSCQTLETPQGAPSEPDYFHVYEAGSSYITLQWAAPLIVNGVISHYKISWDGFEKMLEVAEVETPLLGIYGYKANNLRSNTTYYFHLTAFTDGGNYEGPPALANGNTEVLLNGLSGAAIAGIVVDVILIVTIILIVIIYIKNKKRDTIR